MRYKAFIIAGLALVSVAVLSLQLAADEDDLAQRRADLEQMSDAAKTRLLQKKRRFDGLEKSEKEQYRSLHEELVNDPNYEKLRGTLQRYSDWLKGLDPVDRAELLDMPANERLARVKELMDKEATERFRLMVSEVGSKELPNTKDKKVISEWTDKFIRDHQDEILATVPDHFPVKLEDCDPNKRIGHLKGWYFISQFRRPPPGFDSKSRPRPQGGERPNVGAPVDGSFAALPKPLREEEDELLAKMSAQSNLVIKKATNAEERSQIIQNWLRAAYWSRFTPSLEDLDRFARGLSKEERERLESMPRESMYRELRKLHSRTRGRRGMGRGGFGGPGGPSGRDGGKQGFEGGRGRRGGSSGNKDWGDRGRSDSRSDQEGNPREERSEQAGSVRK